MRARGAAIVRPDRLCGATHHLSGAAIDVLSPCPGFARDRGANDNSFVLRVRYGHRAALLVGDAEHVAESSLVDAYGAALRADFLKVGHHGSKTSSTARFLAAVSPTFAAISCGARNRFGHPHATTLDALANARAVVARTDRDGSVRWTTDGEAMSLAVSREGW
jgi:competence protein ComEC